MITSLTNEKVKYWTSLKLKKNRDLNKCFLVEGDHLVNIALEKNLVRELIITDGNYEFENKYLVTDEVMKKISSQISPSKVAAVVSYLKEDLKEGNVLVLDNIQDPGNLGTMIRSAIAFGFDNIVLGTGTVSIYNEKVIRASEGSLFSINFISGDLDVILNELRGQDYLVVGTDVNGGSLISELGSNKICLIIGNEGKGMNPNIICDKLVNIKMSENIESLNAAVAAAILMYEVYNG